MRPFAATSPFNTPIPAATQWFDTSPLHNISGSSDPRRHWWMGGNSVWVASPTDPLWTFDLPAENVPSYNRVQPATKVTMHGPADLGTDGGDDQLLFLIDGDRYAEVWNVQIDRVNRVVRSGNPSTNGGGEGWAVGNIATGPGAGDKVHRDGVRATNMSVLAGQINGRDIARGQIDHALAVLLPKDILSNTLPYYYPATAWESGQNAWGPIKSGSRLGIPAGTPRPAGLTAIGVMVFDALQTYGAYVGDYVGGDWPMFNYDARTVSDATVAPLYKFWDMGGTSDMDRIVPLLRVADYQPTG